MKNFQILKIKILIFAVLFTLSCAKKHQNISTPVVLADFTVYTESGKEVRLKSSKISENADDVIIFDRNVGKDFIKNGVRYFVFDISYYEGGSYAIVNSKTGEILYSVEIPK